MVRGIWCVTLLVLFSLFSLSAKNPKYLRVVRTNSYILTQQYTLEEIQNQHYKLAGQANTLQRQFNDQFSTAYRNIEEYLREVMGKKYDFLKQNIKNNISSQRIRKKDAEVYLKEVKDRLNGDIPSPILETLLTFNYEFNPENELKDGFTETFYIMTLDKSQQWALTLPQSWKQLPGHRDGVIRDFVSDNGDGLQYLALSVVKSELNTTDSDSVEIAKFQKVIQETLPESAEIMDDYSIKPLSARFAEIESMEKVERYGVPTYVRNIRYFIRTGDSILILECGTFSISSSQKLEKNFFHFSEMYDLIADAVLIKSS